MIKITVKQLQKLKACEAGIEWFKNQKQRSLKLLIIALIKDNHFDYVRWLLSRLLTKKQNQLWAINSAELVLSIFEKQYPADNRPRLAIQAAKDYLAGKITKDGANAAYAATYAATSTASAAAYATYAAAYAASAAAHVTYAAAHVTYAASHAAASAAANAAADAAANAAANAAYAAVDAADAADIPTKNMQIKVCNYALKLLGEIK